MIKKFFHILLFIILLLIIIAAFYQSILFLPDNQYAILYSRIFGKVNKVFCKEKNFVWQKVIPYSYYIKKFSAHRNFRFSYKKNISFLDKDFDVIKIDFIVEYVLNKKKIYDVISVDFNSDDDIVNYIKNNIIDFMDKNIYNILEKNGNLINFINNLNLKNDINLKDEGIDIKNITYIVKNIPINLDIKNLKAMVDKSLAYERKYKFKLREIELQQLKLKQEAKNRVEYLKIIGDYIKENPLILKYLLIEKINKVNSVVIPLSETGFLFQDTINNSILNKLLDERKNK